MLLLDKHKPWLLALESQSLHRERVKQKPQLPNSKL
ncbi:unnamed protein product, partial [marine sediment metagenome]